MPRAQDKPASKGPAKNLDVFSAAEGATPPLPPALRKAPKGEPRVEESPAKRPAATKKTKQPAAAKEQPRRVGRKKTGRNVAFNQTVSLDTANMFYDLHGELDITMGEILERAALALKEQVEKKGESDSS